MEGKEWKRMTFPEGRVKNERAMKGSEEAVEERLVRVRHDPG